VSCANSGARARCRMPTGATHIRRLRARARAVEVFLRVNYRHISCLCSSHAYTLLKPARTVPTSTYF